MFFGTQCICILLVTYTVIKFTAETLNTDTVHAASLKTAQMYFCYRIVNAAFNSNALHKLTFYLFTKLLA